jgi:hypothetical protein
LGVCPAALIFIVMHLKTFIRRGWLALVLVLLICVSAYGRAGGGESFSSGGGSSGGSSGDGGDLDLTDPVCVVILIVTGLAVAISHLFKYLRGNKYIQVPGVTLDDAIPRADQSTRLYNPSSSVLQPAAASNVYKAIAALSVRDPRFDHDKFYTRVRAGFIAVQNAWSEQNLDPVRPFISDAIYERFTLQFAEQRFLGYRNDMSQIGVLGVLLMHAESDGVYDIATVRINAAALDRRLNLEGRVLSGDITPEPFTEYWTFVRKCGAKSVTTGLMEGNCPNCGAALKINQNAQCDHCHAELRGARYDWVLTEITQAQEWQRAITPALPLLPILRQRDPDFTPADLEDRVSVMFWRVLAAQRLGSVNPLRKVADHGFIAWFAPQVTQTVNGQRQCYLDAGVGSVTTIALKPGSAQRPDRALVEIHWSGVAYRLSADRPPQPISENRPRYSWYLLQRSAQCVTNPKQAITSAHCPNCGAPLTITESDACEYCNTPLADGLHGWLLEAVRPHNDPELRQIMDL